MLQRYMFCFCDYLCSIIITAMIYFCSSRFTPSKGPNTPYGNNSTRQGKQQTKVVGHGQERRLELAAQLRRTHHENFLSKQRQQLQCFDTHEEEDGGVNKENNYPSSSP